MNHRIEATFPRRSDALDAVEHLLEAHVAPQQIEMVGPDRHAVPVREQNAMVRPALLGALVGLAGSMMLLAIGATQAVSLPVLADIIDSVGVGGAAVRLGYLGVAVGTVSGALGGLTTWAAPTRRTAAERPHRLRVEPVGDAAEVTDALQASNVVSLRVVA